MLRLKKVAVTGGLSCGKTTVCALMKELGAYVVSADEIVHRLLSPDTPIGKKVIDLFGTVDRRVIAEKVFQNKEYLRKLEMLLHPAVQQEIDREYTLADKTKLLFVAEVPLLFEGGFEKYYDATVAVIADPVFCQARFGPGYEARASLQWTASEKAAKADYVIVNQGDRAQLKADVAKLFNQLITPRNG